MFHQVKKQLVCWCLWLPGARVSVSGDARTCGCLVLQRLCLWVRTHVAAWCSSVRVWGRAHVWLPGAQASVSVGAHTCGCRCSSVRVWGRAHVWLPGARVSVSGDAHTWSFVVCLCLWCQWGATREVVLSVAVKLLFLLPWIIQRSITDVCQPQKLAQ